MRRAGGGGWGAAGALEVGLEVLVAHEVNHVHPGQLSRAADALDGIGLRDLLGESRFPELPCIFLLLLLLPRHARGGPVRTRLSASVLAGEGDGSRCG